MRTSRPSGLSILGLLSAAALFVACSGEPSTESGTDLDESRFGLLSVSYDQEWTDTSASLQLKAHAQFVHFTDMQREYVARLLGLPLDPSRDLPPEDACRIFDVTLDLERDRLEQEEPGHVALLEAGNLMVKTTGGEVTLKPRHFPGLLPFISGVVYAEAQATTDRSADDRSAGQRPGSVAVTTTGGEAVGPFKVQSAGPEHPRLLRVAGQVPDGVSQHQGSSIKDSVSQPQGLSIEDNIPLALQWRASRDAGDVTYLELRYTKGERELALRCRPRDDGDFEIPADLVGQAMGSGTTAGTGSNRLTLEIVRLRRTFFAATGLDRGELRVTVRERATLQSP